MKNPILFFLMFCAYIVYPQNSSAQYKSVFGDSSTEWSIITQTSCRSSHSTHFYDSKPFHPREDTVIKGKTYIHIIAWDIDAPISQYYFLREDTTLGKVWLYTAVDTIERLVMNLGLNIGDTFQVKGRNDNLNFVADSVYYVDNLKHIRLTGEHTFCQKIGERFTFIEGTGTSAGLFYPNRWSKEDSINTYLLCHDKDKIKAYDNNYLSGKCLILSVNEEVKSFSNLKIYPNPINNVGIISFENKERSKVTFAIYDVAGKCLYQSQCSEGHLQFQTDILQKGIFFYTLQSQDGKSASGKLIKQ